MLPWLCAMAGCAGGPTLTSKEVSVYVFSESVPTALFDGFTVATGVKVTVATYETNEELTAGLAARPDAYDLVMPSDYAVDQLVKEGRHAPLDLGAIPHYANV